MFYILRSSSGKGDKTLTASEGEPDAPKGEEMVNVSESEDECSQIEYGPKTREERDNSIINQLKTKFNILIKKAFSFCISVIGKRVFNSPNRGCFTCPTKIALA